MATPATPTPQTVQVVCTLLQPGHQYVIKARPSIEVAVENFAKIYGTGFRYAPTVALKNGETRKIVATQLTVLNDGRIEFDGTIANGSELVKVHVAFYGDSGGYVELI